MAQNNFIHLYRGFFEDEHNYSDEQIIAHARILRALLKMRFKDLSDIKPKDISVKKMDLTIKSYLDVETEKLVNLHYGLKDGKYLSYYELSQLYNIPTRLIVNRNKRALQKLNRLFNMFSKEYAKIYGEDDIRLLNLSANTYLALLRAGIRNISDLGSCKEKDLIKIKFIGKNRAREIICKKEIFLEQFSD